MYIEKHETKTFQLIDELLIYYLQKVALYACYESIDQSHKTNYYYDNFFND